MLEYTDFLSWDGRAHVFACETFQRIGIGMFKGTATFVGELLSFNRASLGIPSIGIQYSIFPVYIATYWDWYVHIQLGIPSIR